MHTVEALRRHGRDHTRKYYEAVVFGDELDAFWGDYSSAAKPGEGESWRDFWDRRDAEAEAAATAANAAKQQGFYVDVDAAGKISSPADVDPRGIDEDLKRAAQVVEMLLIRDHSRMKLDSKVPYDSTHEQQFRLLPVSHPNEFEDWLAHLHGSLDANGEADDYPDEGDESG